MKQYRSILAGIVVALVTYVGYAMMTGDRTLAVTSSLECRNSNIIRCGVGTEAALISAYKANATGDLPAVYAHYGITSQMVTSGSAVDGVVNRDGTVYVGDKLVAKNAGTVGRTGYPQSTNVTIGGKVYKQHLTQVSFEVAQVRAYVFLNADGQFIGAVLASCGNPIYATNVVSKLTPKPLAVYTCDSLTVTQISRTQYRFTTKSAVSGGAAAYNYAYNFGDGVRANGGATIDHTYAKPGTYTISVTFQARVDGSVVNAPAGHCTTTVTVAPEPCPIPGKENVPKDSPECKEDKPSITIAKMVNDVEHYTAKVGETFTYQITVHNTGNVVLKNAVVTDKAPSEVTLVSAAIGTINGNTWTHTIPELGIGDTKSFTLTAKYTKYTTGTHRNTVCADTPTIPVGPDACDDSVTEAREDIVVCDKSDNTVKTIDRSAYDESHMTTIQSECGSMRVCVIAERIEQDIPKHTFNPQLHTTDMSRCAPEPVNPKADTPVAASPKVRELPYTGLSDTVGSGLGISSLFGSIGYYIASRRAIR